MIETKILGANTVMFNKRVCVFSLSSSGPVHGRPGDYAWGPSGLDDIITQMLANLEDSGPPPAKEEKIAALPKIVATEEDIHLCELCCIVACVREQSECLLLLCYIVLCGGVYEIVELGNSVFFSILLGAECSVCKEQFTVGESLLKLPCTHLYHRDCVIPWLKLVS